MEYQINNSLFRTHKIATKITNMKTTEEFKKSVKAAQLEFKEEPMDSNYSNFIAGYPSRLRVRKILNELGDIKGKSIFDGGCEAGYFSIKLLEKGANVTAIDIVEQALEKFKEKLKNTKYHPTIKNAALQDIPFAQNKFDVALATEVLEHAPGTQKCIQELIRVVKPGGKIIITFPNEKNRKPLYPVAKFLGINTSVEDKVTLFELDPANIIKLVISSGGLIKKYYSFPWYFPLTYMIVAEKQ